MTEADSTATATDVPPLVNIGEFWLDSLGLFKAYLPEDPNRPRQPDLDSEQVTLSQVHPEVRPNVATVPDLGADAAWESSLAWSTRVQDDALARCRQLRRAARLRAGLEP